MSIPLVSVIIPVYNVESYIQCCLNSLSLQTLEDFEVLLVDDGSPDRCGDICDEYAQKDSRFKVIHQKNRGVSVARQTGLDNATGEYVIHVDPDDWIETNMLSELYKKAKETGSDMVVCDFWMNETYFKQEINPVTARVLQRDLILGGRIHPSCCNKLVRRECLNRLGISFYPDYINYMEDMLFNVRLLQHNISVCYLPQAFYHYRTTPSSLSQHLSEQKLKSTMYIVAEFQEMGLFNVKTNYCCDQKKDALYMMWQLGHFSELKNTYPEIHNQVIRAGQKYHAFYPRIFFLAMALKGKPRLAFYLYRINMQMIETKEWLQKAINFKS